MCGWLISQSDALSGPIKPAYGLYPPSWSHVMSHSITSVRQPKTLLISGSPQINSRLPSLCSSVVLCLVLSWPYLTFLRSPPLSSSSLSFDVACFREIKLLDNKKNMMHFQPSLTCPMFSEYTGFSWLGIKCLLAGFIPMPIYLSNLCLISIIYLKLWIKKVEIGLS